MTDHDTTPRRGRPRRLTPRLASISIREMDRATHQQVQRWARRHHCTLGQAYTRLCQFALDRPDLDLDHDQD